MAGDLAPSVAAPLAGGLAPQGTGSGRTGVFWKGREARGAEPSFRDPELLANRGGGAEGRGGRALTGIVRHFTGIYPVSSGNGDYTEMGQSAK
jgi:hypothetical protein